MSHTELVVVGTFLNQIEAEMAKGALEAAEIESMISADDAGGLRPHLWMGGVRLLVRGLFGRLGWLPGGPATPPIVNADGCSLLHLSKMRHESRPGKKL